MAVSSSTLDVEIGAVVVGIFAVLVGLYAFNRFMKRRGPEMAAREGKTVLDDRSYNQIRIGQAAAERLARTGVDVSSAKALLDRAEAARAGANYTLSLELSKKAQDSLAAAHAGGSPFPASPSPPPTSTARATPTAAAAPVTARAPGPNAGYTAPPAVPFIAADQPGVPEPSAAAERLPDRPPKNKMEAHFQLSIARDEIDQARAAKPRSKNLREADALLTNSQAAYDRQDFTEALRLALKCRRTLGAKVEALPVSPTFATESSEAGASAAAAQNAGPATDLPTFGQKCSKCGRVAGPTDQFCRACGAAIAPALCGSCGAPLLAGDRFCGKCGATQG